ncbi:hypothetical protein ACQV2E_24470, partial [Pantoea allii]|uniref:hypothetical protein n=1 Tax=Pantoea allii TaxID=574096 RepID=UPI003D31D224
AVERFEQAVSALGADRMTNAPDSNDPDDARLVLPRRNDDEALGAYADRVSAAAARLMRDVPDDVDLRGVGDAAMGGLAADAQG